MCTPCCMKNSEFFLTPKSYFEKQKVKRLCGPCINSAQNDSSNSNVYIALFHLINKSFILLKFWFVFGLMTLLAYKFVHVNNLHTDFLCAHLSHPQILYNTSYLFFCFSSIKYTFLYIWNSTQVRLVHLTNPSFIIFYWVFICMFNYLLCHFLKERSWIPIRFLLLNVVHADDLIHVTVHSCTA